MVTLYYSKHWTDSSHCHRHLKHVNTVLQQTLDWQQSLPQAPETCQHCTTANAGLTAVTATGTWNMVTLYYSKHWTDSSHCHRHLKHGDTALQQTLDWQQSLPQAPETWWHYTTANTGLAAVIATGTWNMVTLYYSKHWTDSSHCHRHLKHGDTILQQTLDWQQSLPQAPETWWHCTTANTGLTAVTATGTWNMSTLYYSEHWSGSSHCHRHLKHVNTVLQQTLDWQQSLPQAPETCQHCTTANTGLAAVVATGTWNMVTLYYNKHWTGSSHCHRHLKHVNTVLQQEWFLSLSCSLSFLSSFFVFLLLAFSFSLLLLVMCKSIQLMIFPPIPPPPPPPTPMSQTVSFRWKWMCYNLIYHYVPSSDDAWYFHHCTYHTAVHFVFLVKVDEHHVVGTSPRWCRVVPAQTHHEKN